MQDWVLKSKGWLLRHRSWTRVVPSSTAYLAHYVFANQFQAPNVWAYSKKAHLAQAVKRVATVDHVYIPRSLRVIIEMYLRCSKAG